MESSYLDRNNDEIIGMLRNCDEVVLSNDDVFYLMDKGDEDLNTSIIRCLVYNNDSRLYSLLDHDHSYIDILIVAIINYKLSISVTINNYLDCKKTLLIVLDKDSDRAQLSLFLEKCFGSKRVLAPTGVVKFDSIQNDAIN